MNENEKWRSEEALRREGRDGAGFDFWMDRASWPIDARGHVFLARAVHEVGSVAFGREWNGREPVDSFLPFPDRSPPAITDGLNAVYAVDLLGRYRPELGLGPVLDFSIYDRPLRLSEWDAALDAFNEHEKQRRLEEQGRFRVLVRRMVKALADEELIAVTRAVNGNGEFKLLPWTTWNTDASPEHFVLCKIGWIDFADQADLLRSEYIFVTRESLDEFKAALAPKVQATEPKANGAEIEGSAHDAAVEEAAEQSTSYPQPALNRWFSRAVEAWRADGGDTDNRPTRDAMVARAKMDFPGVSEQRVRDAWKSLAPPEWRTIGRPRKTRH